MKVKLRNFTQLFSTLKLTNKKVMLSSSKSSRLEVKATTGSVLNFVLTLSTWASRILFNFKKAGLITSDFKAMVNTSF